MMLVCGSCVVERKRLTAEARRQFRLCLSACLHPVTRLPELDFFEARHPRQIRVSRSLVVLDKAKAGPRTFLPRCIFEEISQII